MRYNKSWILRAIIAITLITGLSGCPHPAPEDKSQPGVDNSLSPEEGNRSLAELAQESCQKRVKGKTFEDFKQQVFKEKGANGIYIVNGDTPIDNEKELSEFYENLKDCLADQPYALSVSVLYNGMDNIWNSLDRKNLSYCVSTRFGSRHQQVLESIRAAAEAWERVANVKFVYKPEQDAACNEDNANVLFDVNPVNVNGFYYARAFFPNDLRSFRRVLIDDSSFKLNPKDKLTLTGILRHELGHTLGFRHEHTRPEAGACFEDTKWRGVTYYDAFSVMHYPHCNGKGDWSLKLTEKDKRGAACLYGPGYGVPLKPENCQGASTSVSVPPDGVKKIVSLTHQWVGQNQEKPYGPYPVAPGSLLTVTMTGNTSPGDPDLYVRFKDKPDRANRWFSCRPFLPGANEKCSLDVPSDVREAFVMVHGNRPGNYNLRIEFVKPR
ncbi:MAG: matrixin family metalloprotease [Methylococcus sp.]